MRMGPRWMRLAAGGVTAAILLVGCGDDESGAPAPSGTPTTVAPTSTTLSQIQLDDQKAQRIVLTAADVPGFTMETPEPDDSDYLPGACFNGNAVLLRIGRDDDPRGALSPDFTDSQDATVGSAVSFAETEDEARAAFTALSAPSFTTCFGAEFAKELDSQPEFSNVTATVTRLPALAVGDQSIGYRTTVKARYTGVAVTTYFDFVFVRAGRAVAVVDAVATGTPFSNAGRTRLVTAVAGRLAAP